MSKDLFYNLVELAFQRERLKKLVFSRPKSSEISKISCRLVSHRQRKLLAIEFSLPGNTVSHKNLAESELHELKDLIEKYNQINLITTSGDAEFKCSKEGKEVILGGEKLKKKLNEQNTNFESAIEALDKKKNYILSGEELFLKKLGISSQDGRVHDKKQPKFRQINRFLEHIDDIYSILPCDGEIKIYDLCCGKSYLSFAVYYYLTEIKGRTVYLYGADLKRDVILWCKDLASELGYDGMTFEVGDIKKIVPKEKPDMVISLHACDIATDVVLNTAMALDAKIILSTPCCHRYLNGKVKAQELKFVTDYPHIQNKLCEALTDALRLLRLRTYGYDVWALELTDPENTPKNTLIKAIKNEKYGEEERQIAIDQYNATLEFLLKNDASNYLSEIN